MNTGLSRSWLNLNFWVNLSFKTLQAFKRTHSGLKDPVIRWQVEDLTFLWVYNNPVGKSHCLFIRGGAMYRSLTIGSPLCSLSVGEPGDPGCGDVDWNTEGETEKVTLLTLIVYCQVWCAQSRWSRQLNPLTATNGNKTLSRPLNFSFQVKAHLFFVSITLLDIVTVIIFPKPFQAHIISLP